MQIQRTIRLVAGLVLFMTSCSQTATITLTPNTLPPEGADAEKDDGSWEVEAEIVRSDINALYVAQDGQEYAVSRESVQDVDYPGDGLFHGGFGLLAGTLPVSLTGLSIWVAQSGSLESASSADAFAGFGAVFLTMIAPLAMAVGGATMIGLGMEMKERALDAVAKPTGEREAGMSGDWTLVPMFKAGAGDTVGGVGVLMLF